MTDTQYEGKTGAMLPKSTYYIKNKSALATMARKYGFCIEVIEKTVIIKKYEVMK